MANILAFFTENAEAVRMELSPPGLFLLHEFIELQLNETCHRGSQEDSQKSSEAPSYN